MDIGCLFYRVCIKMWGYLCVVNFGEGCDFFGFLDVVNVIKGWLQDCCGFEVQDFGEFGFCGKVFVGGCWNVYSLCDFGYFVCIVWWDWFFKLQWVVFF